MRQNKRVVLLVEDNEDHAEIIRFHIGECAPDIEVIWLSDGEAAINIVNQAPTVNTMLPWLILLDLKLPRYNGHEVLRAFKSDAVMRRIPVVMLTTSIALDDVEQSLAGGANSYIQKPTEFGGFSLVIDNIIRYWSINQHGVVLERGGHG